MYSAWHDFLAQSGARLEDDRVLDFGDAEAERRAAAEADVLADVSNFTLLEFSGDDAQAFLQGQLTCDVKAIGTGSAMPGAYCSPKGRMLAFFLLARSGSRLVMMLPRALAASIEKRLRMFVLRSKVQITPGNGLLLGAAGPRAFAVLRGWLGERFQPGLQPDGTLIVEVPGGRFLIVVSPQAAPDVWSSLRTQLRPVGTPCWEWLDIKNGLPTLVPATQDKLVPQMANLDLIGAVSFNKGCYTGQEVVARSQYLGKVKRRMYLANVSEQAAPGDDLYSEDLGDQACGLVVNAQRSPRTGYDLLAVLPSTSREGSVVHLKSLYGPVLAFEPLPYEVK